MAFSVSGDAPLKDKIIGWGIIGIPLATLFLLGFIFLRSDPIDQRVVWGCYIASGAPKLDVRSNTIRIADGSGRSLRYVAEPYKDGYRLTVRPALLLRPTPRGAYGFEQAQGIGYFWPLLTAGSDNPRKMRSQKDFGGRIALIAADGTPIIYVRSAAGKNCN